MNCRLVFRHGSLPFFPARATAHILRPKDVVISLVVGRGRVCELEEGTVEVDGDRSVMLGTSVVVTSGGERELLHPELIHSTHMSTFHSNT